MVRHFVARCFFAVAFECTFMYSSIDIKNLKNIKISESYQKHAKPLIKHRSYTGIVKIVHDFKTNYNLQFPKVHDSSFRSPISDCLSAKETASKTTTEKKTAFLALSEI